MEKLKRVGKIFVVFFAIIGVGLTGIFGLTMIADGPSDLMEDEKEVSDDQDTRSTDQTYNVYIEDFNLDVEERYRNAPAEALSIWERGTNYTFNQVNSPQDADIRIHWIKDFGGSTLGHAVDQEFIELGIGNDRCNGGWKPYKYSSITYVAAHEIGHAMGFDHDKDSDLMKPKTNTSYDYDLDREELIPAGYNKAYPTCTSREASEYRFELASDKEVDMYILESQEEFEKLGNREEFSHYPDCSREDITNAEVQCTLASDAVLAISNTNSEAVNVDIRMEEVSKLNNLNVRE